ncbi:Adaptor complexes medium subunit family-domain-containing protein [Apiospora rasikravindrae]|uniref:[acyl-carrier-protein] S-malonyltransferase n=1 Tax=Apiospora rasikravindrae TaxID=990691 RepID=A0ABR1TDL9_9PEZI
MNGVIEALHIYDEHNRAILSHTYTSRPLSASHLLPLYLEHPAPRPNLIYLSNTNPPTLVFSLLHADLLYLATSSSEIEPLLVLEFLHRVVDALEEFLGAPVLAHKIEANYDVVAQLLTEMCDAGTVSTTEPNALREVVEVEGLLGKFLGSLSLPSKAPGLSTSFSNPGTPSLLAQNTPALPWRRANVRHTSNELYADVVETLTVTLAPSGRPIAAFANGTIAFTSKVSGVPDIVMSITGPSGKHNLGSVMELPVFHPCVRLNRWRDSPGELSFIPPDGRFILAGYEVDLLPFTNGKSGSLSSNNLKLPVTIEAEWVALGEEALLVLGLLGGPHSGTAASPSMHDLTVSVPLPTDVRNLSDIRPSKGDATYNPGDKFLEWHIPQKELASGTPYFSLKATVMGPLADDTTDDDPSGFGFGKDYAYDEPYQSSAEPKAIGSKPGLEDDKDAKKIAQNKILMPSSASISFSVKGWIPSGIKIEGIQIDTKRSRGLGEGVKPYKGVKYLTISKGGIEIRRWMQCGLMLVSQRWRMVMNALATAPVRRPSRAVNFLRHGLASKTTFHEPGIVANSGRYIRSSVESRRYGTTVKKTRPRTAIFFPGQKADIEALRIGQGVQKVGMLSPWLEAFPRTSQHILDEIDELMGYKLSDVIQNGSSRVLTATPNAQPAIMATSILILRLLEKEYGFNVHERVDVSLGHSLGEFAALVAAGVLAFEDALYMVRRRAEAMARATQRARDEWGGDYGMIAVVTEPEYLEPLVNAVDDFVGYRSSGLRSDHAEDIHPIDQVLIANINSKNQIVLSGNLEKIKELIAHIQQFVGHDPRAVKLNSDSPFHSPIMKPAVAVMRQLLSGKSRVKGKETDDVITFPGALQCVSNVSARPFSSQEEVRDLLSRQCLETVRWWDSIKYLDQEQKVRRWIGIGPGKVGRNLVGKEVGMRGMDVVKGGGVWAITDPMEVEEALRGLEKTEYLIEEEEEED